MVADGIVILAIKEERWVLVRRFLSFFRYWC